MPALIDIAFYKDYVFYIDQPERLEVKYKICKETLRQKADKAALSIKRKLFENHLPDHEKLINKAGLQECLPDEVPVESIGKKKIIRKHLSRVIKLIACIDEINLQYQRQFEVFSIDQVNQGLVLPREEILRFEKLLPFLRNFSRKICSLTHEDIMITEGLLKTDYICALMQSDFGIAGPDMPYLCSLLKRQKANRNDRIYFPALPARNFLVPFNTLSSTQRVYYCLQNSGINHLKDLMTLSFHELLAVEGLGLKSLIELAAKLADLGTSFTEIYPFMLFKDRKTYHSLSTLVF